MTESQPTIYVEDNGDWTEISTSPSGTARDKATPSATKTAAAAAATSQRLPISEPSEESESIQDRIIRVSEDLDEIHNFYNISGSPTRYARLHEFLDTELAALSSLSFSSHTTTQDDKVDYLLLKNFLSRSSRNLELERGRDAAFADFVEPFAAPVREWCELRQRQRQHEAFHPQTLADGLVAACDAALRCIEHVATHGDSYAPAVGSRAARRIAELRGHLSEMCDFYSGYHPSFDYWVASPQAALDGTLSTLEEHVRDVIVGGGDSGDGKGENENDDADVVVGEPIGRDGLLVELEAEMIPYSPEELLQIAEREYAWCEKEMKKAAAELGFAEEKWRDALEHVKTLYEPGETHPSFVRGLAAEGAAYVRRHDLVTVPRLVDEALTVTRIPPEQQRVSPFFLGGRVLQVAYPRADMAHAAKLMTLRGNNRHFSRATAFHETAPGHRLQLFVGARSRPYRTRLFDTPFFVEGWALYWEMVFWDRGDFFVSAEDRVGSLFWRMHRCIRIVFSLGFHLGRFDARECVRLLVDRVGHEQSTAEGEVRRSLDGSYSPLYQAGYMLGALQLMRLRREVIAEAEANSALFAEKQFHDRILRANVMPIEMLRALLLGKELREDFKSTWRFYGDL